MPDLALPPSLWQETASSFSASRTLPDNLTADVAIIGGGYTGLSAALRCIEHDLKPVVLEASKVGWGASGRNGGVVSTKFRASLSDIAKSHGIDVARRMHEIGKEAVECVQGYVDDLDIQDAGFLRTGNLRCAHNAPALSTLEAEKKVSKSLFGDTDLRLLNKEEARHETGSADFVGGLLSPHAGIIHPLNYARGLARALMAKGGTVVEQCPVIGKEMQEGGRVRLMTKKGAITAQHVVIATNGYSDLFNGPGSALRTAVIPFRSAMVATAPLSQSVLKTLMPEQRSYSETRRMMRWFRRVDNRMLFGGRGAFGRKDSLSAYHALEAALKRLFPQLNGTPITHHWSGLVAMTMNSLPQVGSLDEHTHFALGFNGAGVAMSSLMGRYVADIARGETPDLALLGPTFPQHVPFYSLREPAVRTVAAWYQFLDRIGR